MPLSAICGNRASARCCRCTNCCVRRPPGSLAAQSRSHCHHLGSGRPPSRSCACCRLCRPQASWARTWRSTPATGGLHSTPVRRGRQEARTCAASPWISRPWTGWTPQSACAPSGGIKARPGAWDSAATHPGAFTSTPPATAPGGRTTLGALRCAPRPLARLHQPTARGLKPSAQRLQVGTGSAWASRLRGLLSPPASPASG